MSFSNVDCGAGMATLSGGCCSSRNKLGDASSIFPNGSQGQVAALHLELAQSQDEHRASLAKVTRSLSELSAKLNGAEASWTPWAEVNTLKQEVAEMKNALEHQIKDAKQKQERVEVQEVSSPQARALQGEVAKIQVQRRQSLSDVSQSLAEINTKLQTAETSWSAWIEISDAKQQVADVQNIVDQHLGDAKQQP